MSREKVIQDATTLLEADWDDFHGYDYPRLKELATQAAMSIDALSAAFCRLEKVKAAAFTASEEEERE